MKQLILVLFTFAIVLALPAQEDGYILEYIRSGESTIRQYTKYDISSDYGARGENSYWHRGIDYRIVNQPIGYRILSPCPGTIRKIQGARGYKYVIVEGEGNHIHFGYGHIFQTVGPTITEPLVIGNMVLILTHEDPPNYVILDLNEEQALGIEEGVIIYNGQEYPVTDTVVANQVLAIIGNSMTEPYSTSIHLHLYAFRNIDTAIAEPAGHNDVYNNFDPLSVLNYGTHTQYTCSILEHEIKYGTSGNSYFKTRSTMDNAVMGSRYPNAVMDVDLAELFIKSAFKPSENQLNWGTPTSSYQHYIGPNYTSIIDHGGRPAFNPSELYPIGITTPQGSISKTGIDPVAYLTNNGHPWDNYYFSDFFPRIHKDHSIGAALQLARHNLETRYPDGDYEAHSRITTVKNHVFTTNEPYNFAIDNFLPFVQKVEAFMDGSTTATYVREWKPISSGNFVFDPDPTVWLPKANTSIAVYASEGMLKMSLKINDFYQELTQASNPEKTKWVFSVPADFFANNEKNQLEINGQDIHGNLLQKNAQTIPIRQSATNWNPAAAYGVDVNHKIQIGTSDLNFSYVQLGSGAYRFSASSPHTVYQYNWSYGTENACYNCGSEAEYTFQNTGVYLVNLSVMSSAGFLDVTKEVVVQPLIAPVPNFYYSPRPWPPNRGKDLALEVDFYDNTEGIVTSYSWDFGNGETSNEQNPKGISFQANTSYNVNLLVEGKMGIGTFAPTEKLEVLGKIKTNHLQIMEGRYPGYLLLSDAAGNAVWTNPESITNIGPWARQGSFVYVGSNQKVGIGTSQPLQALHVEGNMLLGNNGNIIGNRSSWQPLKIFSGSDENQAHIALYGNYSDAGSIKLYSKGASGQIEFHNATNKILALKADNSIVFGDPNNACAVFVNGELTANQIRVNTGFWWDRVFSSDYALMPLADLRDFITQNRHLPDIPNEATVLTDGIELGEMNGLLLKKIEELTLYLLEQDRKINTLQTELQQLKNAGINN